MSKRALTNLERAKKWEKKEVDKAITQLILSRAEEIVNQQIEASLSGSLQAGQYLIDRTFGKARQNIGLDGGQDNTPIVFMPSALVQKFALDKPLTSTLPEGVDILPTEDATQLHEEEVI